MNRRLRLGALVKMGLVFSVACLPLPLLGQTTRGTTESDVMLAVLARMEKLENLEAAYDSTTINIPMDPEKVKQMLGHFANQRLQNTEKRIPIPENIVQSERFSHLNGNVRFEWDVVSGDHSAPTNVIWVRTPHRSETYSRREPNPPCGVIRNTSEFPDSTIDLALGFRCYEVNSWLSHDVLHAAVITDMGGGRYKLELKDERNGARDVWTIDSRFGYAPTHYCEEMVKDGQKVIEIEANDFRDVGGVMLPYRMDRTLYQIIEELGTLGSKIQTARLDVKEYKVGDADNKEAKYTIIWPKGTQILDKRISEQFIIVGNDHALDDAAIAKILQRNSEIRKKEVEEAQKRIDKIQSRAATLPSTSLPSER